MNFLNADKRLVEQSSVELFWRSVTTGNRSGFDLWLAEEEAGELAVGTPHVTCQVPIAEIGFEDKVFEAGGLKRRVRIFRLPDANPTYAMRLERKIRLKPGVDNALYVALTQEDGHRAWSSPIYLVA